MATIHRFGIPFLQKLLQICTIYIFVSVSITESVAPKNRCTYSFTVHGKDALCSSSANSQMSLASPHEDHTNHKLLETVTRLLEKQVNDEGQATKTSVKDLEAELLEQKAEQKLLHKQITELRHDMELMLSSQHSEDKTKDKLFDTFNGVTARFLGCPVKSSRRVHEIAPLKKRFDQLIKLVPRSCLEWKQQGFWAKGLYMIDPDGLDGLGPFEVECIMADKPITVIHHSHENRSHVVGYDESGSFIVDPVYQGVTNENLEALIKMSSKCEQFLKWECKGASLSIDSWWVDRHGQRMDYWAGGKDQGCACWLTNSCDGGNLCNCDRNDDKVWTQDAGYVSDLTHLPVKQLRFGDTGNYNEEGYHTLGPLRCYSNITNPLKESSALLPVQIYPSFNVFCDYDGWMIIQRNTYGSPLSWDRDWEDYKNGFGDIHGDFWLGLEKMYQLTNQGHTYTLMITLVDSNSLETYSQYTDFKIYSENYKYLLQLGAHSGTLEDQLYANNGMQFTTPDNDNDRWTGNCAKPPRVGGWWYADCGHVTLNGPDLKWGGQTGLQATEMKIILTSNLIK